MDQGGSGVEVNRITEKIIGCAYTVSNGFLEKVYENALAHELRMRVSQQHGIKVLCDGIVVGEYVADLFVEGRVLVELEAVRALERVMSKPAFCLETALDWCSV